MIEELVRRREEGTLDEVLIPDDADIRPLLDELFPIRSPSPGRPSYERRPSRRPHRPA